ncbi:MAG: GAF domain-containing protein [Candidatus Pedobacter colombiensis]|uniref:GAF domain-containing protein n=1 Tax=Candidatus Pedobacter colombiensis TaxID=3121371 RepID=A0AAJ5W7Y9_9SPHI|nr:GAF domain-containing protein [Pedobacter sp.]WEK18838.1 MAG: GAF domain-containing protein [Pedobacter sp.]
MEKKIRNSIALDKQSRLEKSNRYRIIYTKSETVFDDLAILTATIFDTPIAVINFVDQDYIWSKVKTQTNRGADLHTETSVCSLAILNEGDEMFEGLSVAPRLMSNPLIVGELGMKFYAAVPITTDEGFHAGSVCIIDKKHRTFMPHERKKLELIAAMVRKEMNKKMAKKIYA